MEVTGSIEFESALRDGTRLHFRRIHPSDKQRLVAGLEQLSPESRYLRFFRHVDHLSDAQLDYLTNVDFIDHFAWVATLPDEDGEPLCGVGRWIRDPTERDIAEGAVVVADYLHNQGIGRTLLWLMARSAIDHGVKAFRAWTLGENHPMLQVLHDMGAKSGRWEGGVLELIVPLPDDPDALEETPAPLVLKATAAGVLHGEAHPERPAATRLIPPPRIL
jgi:hypothetical protein